MERTWTGRIRAGADGDHERHVGWLNSAEGRAALGRALLDSYRLVEADGRLTVRFGAPGPPPIIRFLRHPRFWPEFWEFESAAPDEALDEQARERVAWTRALGDDS